MNLVESQVVNFLNSAIHGKKIEIEKDTYIDWNKIIDELKAHKIEALVYSAIKKETFNNIDKELLNEWKKGTFQSGVFQLNHIKQVECVLNLFNENNIPVIVLKGLVIRDLYPRPELRTMCDADILVHKEDLDRVRELLISIGYTETESSDVHLNFFRGATHIEVHWIITKEHYFNEIPKLEEEIWENAVEVFVEQRGHDVNWDEFLEKVKLCGIETFSKTIFALSKELFNMEIPTELQCEIDKDVINALADDIFSSGVHCKRDMASLFAKELAYDGNNKNDSVINKYMSFLFPQVDKMSEKYDYAKKNKLLTPVAWGHHLIRRVFNKDYSLKEKTKFTTETVSVSQKRNDLINYLEL